MKRILAGPNAVVEALRASPGAVEVVCLSDGLAQSTARKVLGEARRARVDADSVPRETLDRLARGLPHQGVIALTGSYPYLDLDGLLAASASESEPLIVILDQVQDPRNLGAIVRSACAFGAAGILLTRNRAAPVTAAAVRASAGSTEIVRIARVTNLARAMDRLREEGFSLWGAAVDAKKRVDEVDWAGPSALVLGNEARGLRRLTAERCDGLFSIRLSGGFDSLNVSAATAVCLYEASRRRALRRHVPSP